MSGVYSTPYTEMKRWCSCLGREWDLWYGGVPIKHKPKYKELARYEDVNGNSVTLLKLTYTPLECYSKNNIISYRVVADYKVFESKNWAGNTPDYNSAMRIFMNAVKDMLEIRMRLRRR